MSFRIDQMMSGTSEDEICWAGEVKYESIVTACRWVSELRLLACIFMNWRIIAGKLILPKLSHSLLFNV